MSRFVSFLTWTLALLTLSAGLWAALFAAGLLRAGYTPVPFNDEWMLLDFLRAHQGRLPLDVLFSQHNEHRVVVARLVGLADLHWFRGQGWMPLLLIYLVQSVQAGLFGWVAYRHARLRGPALVAGVGLGLFCAYSAAQFENFIWGFQVAFVAAFASAHAGCVVAGADREGKRLWWIALALAALFLIATFSVASGILLGPLLAVTLWRFYGARGPAVALLGLNGLVAFLYFRDLKPMMGVNPASELRRPLELISYGIVLLRESLPVWFRERPGLVVIPAVLLIVGTFAWHWWKRQRGPALIWSMLGCFVLGNVFLTALGRIKFGVQQATESRYQTPALLFWTAVALLLLTYLRERRILLALYLLLMFSCMSERMRTWQGAEQGIVARQTPLDLTGLSLITGAWDREELRQLGMHSDVVTRAAPYLDQHGLTVFAWKERFAWGQPFTSRFELEQAAACEGEMDGAQPLANAPGYFKVQGWVADQESARGRRWVLLTDENGVVMGVARGGIYRADLRGRSQRLVDDTAGFLGYSKGVPARVYAIRDRGYGPPYARVCALPVRLPEGGAVVEPAANATLKRR